MWELIANNHGHFIEVRGVIVYLIIKHFKSPCWKQGTVLNAGVKKMNRTLFLSSKTNTWLCRSAKHWTNRKAVWSVLLWQYWLEIQRPRQAGCLWELRRTSWVLRMIDLVWKGKFKFAIRSGGKEMQMGNPGVVMMCWRLQAWCEIYLEQP